MTQQLLEKWLGLAIAMACSAFLAATACADSYPARPIRLIVPFAPGGGVDFISRALAQKLADGLGQPVVVDNRSGAGGIVGAALAARASADGYTLVMGNNSTHAVLPAVTRKMPYDAIRDFTPLTMVAGTQNLLVANNTLPARTVRDLIELAKAKPGQISYGSAGQGSQTHLSGELLNHVAGIRMNHVPYKGSGPGYVALLGGEIHVLFGTVPGSLPHVQAGRLRALAITGEKRSSILAQTPTLLEQGITGFESGLWYALLAPANLPGGIAARIQREVVKAVHAPDVRKVLVAQGSEPIGSSPEQCAAEIRKELDMWTGLVRSAGLRFD